MPAYGLTLAVFLSALATLRAAYATPYAWFYLFKPLTTALILFLALLAPAASAFYQYAIAAGLVFSLAGDIFLMLPAKRFVWGLASFLIAHLCYIVAFTARAGLREPLWLGLPFLALALVAAWQITPRARGLRRPTTVYALVLITMAWRACVLWAVVGDAHALLASLGALLFILSDTTLAVNRFMRRFRYAQMVILSTYYAAQCLIAWSV
jgi:uncharacterized membrane protein YhhN